MFSESTGLILGKLKVMDVKSRYTNAMMLMGILQRPRLHGPSIFAAAVEAVRGAITRRRIGMA